MLPHGAAAAPAPPRPPSSGERAVRTPFTSPPPPPPVAQGKQLLTTSSLNFRRKILRQYSVAPPAEYFDAERIVWLPHFARDLADLVLCLEGYSGPSDAAYLETAISSYIQWAAFVKKIQVNSSELAEELDFIRRLFPRFTKAVVAVAREQEITLPPPVPETMGSLLKLPELEDAVALELPWRGATATPASPRLEPPPPPTPRTPRTATPPTTPAESTFSSPTSRSFEPPPRPETPQQQRQDHPATPQRPYHPLPHPPISTSPRALPPHPPLAVPDSPRSIPPPLSPHPNSPKHSHTPSPRPVQPALTPSPRPQPPVLAPNPRPPPQQPVPAPSPRPPQPPVPAPSPRPPQQQAPAPAPSPRPPQQAPAPAPSPYPSQNAPSLRHKSSHTELAQPQLQLSFPMPNSKHPQQQQMSSQQPQLKQKSSQHFRVAELSHQLAPPAQCTGTEDRPPTPPPKGNQHRFMADSEQRASFYGQQQHPPPMSYYNPAPNPPQPSNNQANSSNNRQNRPQPTVATNSNQWQQDRRQPYRPPKLVIPSPLGPVHTDNGVWKNSNEGNWDARTVPDGGWPRNLPPGASSIVPTPVTARAPLVPNTPAPRPSSDYETVRLRANVNPELLADRPLSHPSSLQRRGAQHQGGIVARRPSTKPKRTVSVRRGGSRPSPANGAPGAATPLATYPSRHPQRRGTAESTSNEFATQLARATYPVAGQGRQEIMSDGPEQDFSEFGALGDPYSRQRQPQPREYEPQAHGPPFYENGSTNNPNPPPTRRREPSWVSIDSEEELRPQVRTRPESPYSPVHRPAAPNHTPSSLPWDRSKRPTSAASWVTVDSVASGGVASRSPPIPGRAPEPWRDHTHTSSQDWIPQPQRARPISRHSMDQVSTAQVVPSGSGRRESEPAALPMGFRPQPLVRREEPNARLRRDLSIDSTHSLPPPPPPYGT